MRSPHRLVASLAFVSIASAAHADASDCQNVDISVTNQHPSGDPIKVTQIAYDVGGWWVEGLADTVLNQHVVATWNNQDLGQLPEGTATYWLVYYKRQLSGGVFPKYGDELVQQFSRLNRACYDGDSYSFTIDEWGTEL